MNLALLCRPKGENIDVKTIGDYDGENYIDYWRYFLGRLTGQVEFETNNY